MHLPHKQDKQRSRQMKQKTFKFTVSRLTYPASLDSELRAIRELIGNFTVVKVKKCWFEDMHIWVVPKD